MQIFTTVDTNEITLVHYADVPSSHKRWFMKSHDNKVWEEDYYKGDATFGNKNYFALLAESNMSQSRLKKCGYSAEVIGKKIYEGRVKLIEIKGGKQVDLEVKWPEICADDERPWKNRKPQFNIVDTLEYPVLEEECECDLCCGECC